MQVNWQLFHTKMKVFRGSAGEKVEKLESVLWTGSENGYVWGKHDSTIRLLIEF